MKKTVADHAGHQTGPDNMYVQQERSIVEPAKKTGHYEKMCPLQRRIQHVDESQQKKIVGTTIKSKTLATLREPLHLRTISGEHRTNKFHN